MILELTNENLLIVGFDEQEAIKQLNRFEDSTFQCNIGNSYISITENKLYTDIDFYRKTCFENGKLYFPYNCPDLAKEYFELALAEFLKKQKEILGILFNEKDQFYKFISFEITSFELRITYQKEFLEKMKHHNFESKKNDIHICEGYIEFLKTKNYASIKIKNENKPKKLSEKWHALHYWFELTAHGNTPPMDIEGGFIKSELEEIGAQRCESKGQSFYRAFKEIDINDTIKLDKGIYKGWKKIVLELSKDDSLTIDYINEKYK
ncbi:hypothetical protein [Flavobacterium yafengii]|uniref:hypothetical protein n=1 Tax=Flavobacterium yafengii TaxID=3041253 RepID=UPI0024A9618B|nr:hypothetical protein [Flavobacterium yafengii]MDI6046310.1 hypothetical protein [Flavobacterium yafengii]